MSVYLLNPVKCVIDLKRSLLDEAASNPDKGEYRFKKKAYINYLTKDGRPPYWFTWERYDQFNGYREYRNALVQGYSPVINKIDPYVPEGALLHADGDKWTFDDVVLMKCPLVDELRRRKESKDISESQRLGRQIEAFQSDAASQGAEIKQDEMDKLLESFQG